MWSAIITGAATIVAVLYVQGPIVGLLVTAISCMALLIVLRASEHNAASPEANVQPLSAEDLDEKRLTFPALRRQAS